LRGSGGSWCVHSVCWWWPLQNQTIKLHTSPQPPPPTPLCAHGAAAAAAAACPTSPSTASWSTTSPQPPPRATWSEWVGGVDGACAYVCWCLLASACVQACLRVRVRVCERVRVRACVRACMRTCMYACMCTRVRERVRACAHARARPKAFQPQRGTHTQPTRPHAHRASAEHPSSPLVCQTSPRARRMGREPRFARGERIRELCMERGPPLKAHTPRTTHHHRACCCACNMHSRARALMRSCVCASRLPHHLPLSPLTSCTPHGRAEHAPACTCAEAAAQ